MTRLILAAAAVLAAGLALTAAATLSVSGAPAAGAAKIRVAVVTGGHAYDEKPFLEVFQGQGDIAPTHVALKAGGELFEDTSQFPYDVIFLYNMTQKITEKQRQNFVALLDKGVGLVVTHHALGAWQDWPEFKTIAGGKYYVKEMEEDGVKHAKSTYKHDVDFKVHIADAACPIVKGMADFEIHDETYKGYWASPQAKIFLTTDEPTCEKAIGWINPYHKARVCYFELGHDSKAYANPGYRALAINSIRWAAGRLP